MKISANLVSDLNAVTLKEEDLVEAIKASINAYDTGECHLMTGVITTMQLFAATPYKAKAIVFRLQALAIMMEKNELRNWTQSDGITVVPAAQKALISAAANHPLSLIDGEISFEKESFLQRVLEFAEPQGNRQI